MISVMYDCYCIRVITMFPRQTTKRKDKHGMEVKFQIKSIYWHSAVLNTWEIICLYLLNGCNIIQIFKFWYRRTRLQFENENDVKSFEIWTDVIIHASQENKQILLASQSFILRCFQFIVFYHLNSFLCLLWYTWKRWHRIGRENGQVSPNKHILVASWAFYLLLSGKNQYKWQHEHVTANY